MTEQYLFRRINVPGTPRAAVATGTVLLTTDDSFVAIDVTAGSQNAALPRAELLPGMRISIQKSDVTAFIVQIIPIAPNTINAAANPALTTQFDSVTMQSDGEDWNVVAEEP